MLPEFLKGFLNIDCCYKCVFVYKAAQCILIIHCISVEYDQKDHFKLANNFIQQEVYWVEKYIQFKNINESLFFSNTPEAKDILWKL